MYKAANSAILSYGTARYEQCNMKTIIELGA